MESFPQMGVFQKAVICACVYQFFCVYSGLSLECSGITCGYGTEPNCSSDSQCTCAEQFSTVTTRLRYGRYIQYCFHSCYNITCHQNFAYITRIRDHTSLCKSTGVYRRSAIGKCIDNCHNGTCPQKFVCTIYKHSPINLCECGNGYRRSYTGECVESCDMKKCGIGIFCSEKYFGAFCEGNCVAGYQNDSTGKCKDLDECSDKRTCADKKHSVCINTAGSYRCDCIQGYTTTTTTTTAASSDLCEDVNECEENPLVCGEHSVCENHPGNYSCQCQEGYALNAERKSCVIFRHAESGPADPITGSSVGVYVGTTFGVLALIGFIIAAILIRRRRNSHHQGASEGTNSMFPRQVEENSVTFEAYENANTAINDAILPSEKREQDNPAYAVNFNEGTPQSRTQNGGSVDAFYVNAKHTSKTEKKDGEYQNVFTETSDKALKFDDTNGDSNYETMSLGLTGQLNDESRMDGNSEVLNITGDASGNRHGSDDYCTLGINAGNVNDDDQHAYSGLVMSDKDLQFQEADYYNIKN